MWRKKKVKNFIELRELYEKVLDYQTEGDFDSWIQFYDNYSGKVPDVIEIDGDLYYLKQR